jgi:hypothetical protein
MEIAIKIQTTTEMINTTGTVDFTFIELPYGAKGHRFDGTSTATEENLLAYWQFVDEIFNAANIQTSDYVSLINIIADGIIYGIIECHLNLYILLKVPGFSSRLLTKTFGREALFSSSSRFGTSDKSLVKVLQSSKAL